MKPRRQFSSAITATFVVLMLVQPTTVAASCFTPNAGAYWRQYALNRSYTGAKSSEDFESATVPNNYAIVHPMQYTIFGKPDFIGFGTRRGEGTHDPDASSNCPDDYSTHWHMYADGRKFGVYFCTAFDVDIDGTATSQQFTMRWGDCNGNTRLRVFLNGTRLACYLVNGYYAYDFVVGGEVLDKLSGGQKQKIDIRYADLNKYHSVSDSWGVWDDETSPCSDPGYDVEPPWEFDISVRKYP